MPIGQDACKVGGGGGGGWKGVESGERESFYTLISYPWYFTQVT